MVDLCGAAPRGLTPPRGSEGRSDGDGSLVSDSTSDDDLMLEDLQPPIASGPAFSSSVVSSPAKQALHESKSGSTL